MGLARTRQSDRRSALELDEVNDSLHADNSSASWKNNPNVIGTLVGTTTSKAELQGQSEGKIFGIKTRFKDPGRGQRTSEIGFYNDAGQEVSNGSRVVNPQNDLLWIRSEGSLPDTIDLTDLTDVETNLLLESFGLSFSASAFLDLSSFHRNNLLEAANDRLKSLCEEMFPAALRFLIQFRLDGDLLEVVASDHRRTKTKMSGRGSGLQAFLYICVQLLPLIRSSKRDTVILIDEPETGLHADSQHRIRRILENLASRDNVQIIYTTHSPSMINTMRPRSIRVIERDLSGDIATSRVNNQAFTANFHHVRRSIGLTPADSLLFSQNVVVVEGKTECQSLPDLISLALSMRNESDDQIEHILSEIAITDGGGDSFPAAVRIANAQGAHCCVFLDGDRHPGLAKLRKDFPNLPIIKLPETEEIEDLLPFEKILSAYLYLTNAALEEGSGEALTVKDYENWFGPHDFAGKLATTKRISRFLQDHSRWQPPKQDAFARAFASTEADSGAP